MDESTDKNCTKHLCMVARLYTNDKVRDNLLGLIPLQDDARAQTIELIVTFFLENNIFY